MTRATPATQTGKIPDSMFKTFGDASAFVTYVDLSSNPLCCCGVGFNRSTGLYTSLNYSEERLPPGFYLSPFVFLPVPGIDGFR